MIYCIILNDRSNLLRWHDTMPIDGVGTHAILVCNLMFPQMFVVTCLDYNGCLWLVYPLVGTLDCQLWFSCACLIMGLCYMGVLGQATARHLSAALSVRN